MMIDRCRGIPPLTRGLLPKVPWFLRWSGWLNNRWNESVIDALLATREKAAVMEAWATVSPDAELVKRVLAVIGQHMSWEDPRFTPKDECFIVMKLWWHGFADNLEREGCLWAIERVCNKKFPSSMIPAIIDMTLGDFLGVIVPDAEEEQCTLPTSRREGA